MNKKWLLSAGLAVVAGLASAQSVDVAKSQLSFTFSQEAVPVEGSFKKFAATVNFDPAKPAAGNADIVIDLLSVNGGSPDATTELAKPAWFDSAKSPKARFVASGFKAIDGGKFQAPGKLTLKGKTLPVVVTFTAKPAGKALVLDGTAVVSRLQFLVGDGTWKDTDTVADAVNVKFHLQVNS